MAVSVKKSQHFWSEEETKFMLFQLKELNILRFIDGRKHRNAELYKLVGQKMKDAGFTRTVEQIRCRWKALKQAYFKTKSHNNTSGLDPASCAFYDELSELLANRPMANTVETGVDIGFDELNPTEDENATPSTPPPHSEDDDLEVTAPELNTSETPSRPTSRDAASVSRPDAIGVGPRRQKVGITMSTWSTQHQSFLERMQKQQNEWLAAQLAESHEREERMISAVVEANARSTERIVSLLLEGLRNTMPQPMFPPYPFQGYPQPPHPPTLQAFPNESSDQAATENGGRVYQNLDNFSQYE